MNQHTGHESAYFPASLTLRIDWSEMDEFSHINNLMFMKYIQSARVNYWQLTGIYDLFKSTRIGPMLLSSGCKINKPLFFPGEVTIKTRTVYIRKTSFSFEHRLYNQNGECVAEGTDVMVMYDFNQHEKHPVPAQIRDSIAQLEGRMDLIR